MPHDHIYVCDANLIICFNENTILGWRDWVNAHKAAGKLLYYLPRTKLEVHTIIDPVFTPLRIAECDVLAESATTAVYEEICNRLNIVGNVKNKLRGDLKLIAEVGFYVASSEDISDEAVLHSQVVFASSNFKCIKRILNTPEKRAIVEEIIDKHGLEHLITVRCVRRNQTYEDYF